MPRPPEQPKIYHITPAENLPSIIAGGELVSDATMIARGGPATTIGMARIKEARLTLPVKCHAGDHVADYVPFYFCPRSVMLYLIYKANHPDLAYKGGQEPVVHLEGDLHDTVTWARSLNRRWAFTLSNAGAAYAEFRRDLARLSEIKWHDVQTDDWSGDPMEGKQAEFLLRDSFPWELVGRIGVFNMSTRERVVSALDAASHKPPVELRPDWYY